MPNTDRARSLTAACAVGGAAGWSLTAAGAGATSIAPAYGVGLVGVGLMTTAVALIYAALQLPAGVVVDRVGVRRASAVGLGLVVVVHAVASVAPVTGLALACRALAGVGCAVCFVSGADLVRRSGAGPSALGVFGGVSLAAGGAAVVGVPLLEPLLAWRSAWITSGALALLALTCVLLVPSTAREAAVAAVAAASARSAAPSGTAAVPRRSTRGHGPSLLRDGELHRLAAVHAVTLGLGLVISTWAAVVLASSWGFGRPAAAVTGSLVLGLTALSRPLGGHLARRWPERVGRTCAASLVVCAVATAALAVPTAPVVAVAAVVALGLAGGLPFAAVIAAGQARWPDRPAAAVGLLNSGANLVVVVAAPLVGAAIEGAATTPAFLVLAVLWVVPLLARPTSTRSGGVAGGCRGSPAAADEDRLAVDLR